MGTQCHTNDLYCPVVMKQCRVVAPCITPCTSLSRPLLFGPTKELFFFFASFFVHDAAPSRLYFVKVSLSLIPRTGEQGQIYRKRGLPQGVTSNNVARFLSRFKSSSLVKKLLNYSIITLNISLQKLQFF